MPINNSELYDAVVAGISATNQSWLIDIIATDYIKESNIAAAVATEVDSLIPTIVTGATISQRVLLESISKGVMTTRTPQSITPSNYNDIANAIVALFIQMVTKLQNNNTGSNSNSIIKFLPEPSLILGTDDAIAINTFLAPKADNELWIVIAPPGAVYHVQSPAHYSQNLWWIGGEFINDIGDDIIIPSNAITPLCASPAKPTWYHDMATTLLQAASYGDRIVWLHNALDMGLAPGVILRIESPNGGNLIMCREIMAVDPIGVLRVSTFNPSVGHSVVITTTTGTPLPVDAIVVDFTNGCTIGVAGGQYKVSLDAGTTYGAITPLGTSATINVAVPGGTVHVNFGAGTVLTNELITVAPKITLTRPLQANAPLPIVHLTLVFDQTRNIYIKGVTFRYGTSVGRLMTNVNCTDITWDSCKFYDRPAAIVRHDSIGAFDLGCTRGTMKLCQFYVTDQPGPGRVFQSEGGDEDMLYERNEFIATEPSRQTAIWSQMNSNCVLRQNAVNGLLGGIVIEGANGLTLDRNEWATQDYGVGGSTGINIIVPQNPSDPIIGVTSTHETFSSFYAMFCLNAPTINGLTIENPNILDGLFFFTNAGSGIVLRDVAFNNRNRTSSGPIPELVLIDTSDVKIRGMSVNLGWNLFGHAIDARSPVDIDGFTQLTASGAVFSIVALNLANVGTTSRITRSRIINSTIQTAIYCDTGAGNTAGIDVEDLEIGQSFDNLIQCATGSAIINTEGVKYTAGRTIEVFNASQNGALLYSKIGDDCNFATDVALGVATPGAICRVSQGTINTDAIAGTTEVFYRWDIIRSTDEVMCEWVDTGTVGAVSWRRDFINVNTTLRGIYLKSTNIADTNKAVFVNIG